MFLCKILLLALTMEEGEPIYYEVGVYNFDPGFKQGDEISINWKIDKRRIFKVKVVNREKIIYPKGSYEEQKDDFVYLLNIIVESEDRNQILEIKDFLEPFKKKVC